MERVWVVGTSGSGKTTLAAALAARMGAPHVELDALHWKPDWTEANADDFMRDVLAATDGPRWVVCGNYRSKLGETLLHRADTIAWIDLPMTLVLWQMFLRSVRRSLRRTESWSGNRERLGRLFTRESLLLWVINTHGSNRRRYEAAMADPRWARITWVRLRSRKAVRAWLERAA